MAPRLFSSSPPAPWAEKLRPTSLAEFVGQRHLVGAAGLLGERKLHSMLLWGPPGCGKTTLARILAHAANAEMATLSPVSSGVKELRAVVARAGELSEQEGRQTVVFVDEAHRFNKAQQDYFLPHVETGLIIFVGATTENPSFEINAALLSRLVVYRLDPLSKEELGQVLARVVAANELALDAAVAAQLVEHADGDARRLINLVEQLAEDGGALDEASLAKLNFAQLRRHDRKGDEFYDQISALIKSVRGSNPDAALYWLCRMLDGGAPPLYISRRLIRLATEDVGLADPAALGVTLDADKSYRVLGSPEGELSLAQAAVYLATAPKSNAVYRAFAQVGAKVAKGGTEPVPLHLRNAPTELMRSQGNAEGYRYAHDEPHAYAAGVDYLPAGMEPLAAYAPSGRGFEKEIAKRMAALRKLDAKVAEPKPAK